MSALRKLPSTPGFRLALLLAAAVAAAGAALAWRDGSLPRDAAEALAAVLAAGAVLVLALIAISALRSRSPHDRAGAGDLDAAAQEIAVLHAVASRLSAGGSTLEAVVEELTALDWVDGAFLALADERGRLVRRATAGLDGADVDSMLDAVQEAYPPGSIERGLYLEDAAASPAARGLAAAGAGAVALAPLQTPEGVAGVVGCVARRPLALPEARRAALRSVAHVLAVALQGSELADEAAESRRLAGSVLRQMSDGVIVLDAEDRCRVCNPAAAMLLGVERARVVGEPAAAWFPLPASLLQALRARLERPDEAAGPLPAEHNGRRLALTAGPLAGSEGGGRGMILVIRDLSGEAEAERVKRDFVSMVGHELRTPLTMIRGSVDLLKEQSAGTLSDTQRRLVEMLDANSERLLRLIDDLLDMSALDSGRVEVRREAVDLARAVGEAVEAHRVQAESRSIALRAEFPGGAPGDAVPVWADRARLGQVLSNLIGNALKYTGEGGHVTVRVVASSPLARVDVRDDGIGIPPEEQPRLFERFYRTGEGRRQSGGTGLGLAIARSIVELHGGEIWCESDGRRGSTFSFTVPRRPPGGDAELKQHQQSR